MLSFVEKAKRKVNEELLVLNDIEINYNKFFDNTNIIQDKDIEEFKEMNHINKPLSINFFVKLFIYPDYKQYLNQFYESSAKIKNIYHKTYEHNESIIKKITDEFQAICGNVEGIKLSSQQILSIIDEAFNNLVVAGAGTGKTTTIIGKVKYLILKEKINPKDILLLSFTNASADEMKQRIKKELNVDLDVYTFHKLGLEILKETTNNIKQIFSDNLTQFICNQIKERLSDKEYLNNLVNYLNKSKRDDISFNNEEEYLEYLKYNPPTTLNDELVKSYGELEIANYLYKNGINYNYEKLYEYDTYSKDFLQYTPDFYLPDYKIYIEYFGVNKNFEVADYFKSKNNHSASENYNESIKWKRETHQKYNTILIESYAYESFDGNLLENLEKNLKKYNVKFAPIDNETIWNNIKNKNSGIETAIAGSFGTMINLIKSNDNDINTLIKESDTNYERITLHLLKPILDSYNKYLKDNNLIDFNDMINLASKSVKEGKFINPYKHVIVDEYQDISMARYNLLRNLRMSKPYKLFCVGDDWQSIYRFSGSNINLITNFENYWGDTSIHKIGKTYRYSNRLAKISEQFILENPNQIRKNIEGEINNEKPLGIIKGVQEKYAIELMLNYLLCLEKNSSVFIIGRYKYDLNILKKIPSLTIKYNHVTEIDQIYYNERKDLDIKFITAHKSKGLQADYVIIINNLDALMGFPSKISDPPLVDKLLSSQDDYPYSEERRLFYVAMTRSKKKTLFLVVESRKSVFIKELENNTKDIEKIWYKCPHCHNSLIKRKGPYGEFLGCKNYPECKYIKKLIQKGKGNQES